MFSEFLNFQPINTDQYSVSGDVTIYPGAAIAPGVLLQADVGSRIVIRAGVCIGLGSVIHASHGTITIHDGANLGAGVLLIGDVTIGARACLGTAVTVINSSVEARKILESGTVLGDRSRRSSIDELIESIPLNSTPVSSSHKTSPKSSSTTSEYSWDTRSVEQPVAAPEEEIQPEPIATPVSSQTVATPIEPITPVSKPIVSTFQYPEPTPIDYGTGLVMDNSGKPWQSCDPNPWDPTDRPAGETTCQITSKPKDPTPFNENLFAEDNHSSSYPPYPQQPVVSTFVDPTFTPLPPIASTFVDPTPPSLLNGSVPIVATPIVSTFVDPNPTPQTPPEPIVSPDSPKTEPPKPVYGQDYVNQMLGKMSGRY